MLVEKMKHKFTISVFLSFLFCSHRLYLLDTHSAPRTERSFLGGGRERKDTKVLFFFFFVSVVHAVALDRVPGFSERSGALAPLFLGLFGLLLPLGKDLGVLGSGLTVLLGAAALQGDAVTLALEHHRGDQTLDLGRLEDKQEKSTISNGMCLNLHYSF